MKKLAGEFDQFRQDMNHIRTVSTEKDNKQSLGASQIFRATKQAGGDIRQ